VATNNKFIRRLRRELTANPKKTAVLALLLLVAIVFWAPLVEKWIDGQSDDVKTAPGNVAEVNQTRTGAANPEAVAGTPSASNTAKTTTPQWNQMLSWIRNDPRMQPYTREEGDRDPFSLATSQIAQKKEATAEPPPPEITPKQAGIVLHSTVVGSRMKTALINGRAYHEEQSVLSASGHDRFVLVEIRPDAVVLSRHGQLYEVKLRTVETADSND
jgi:hypothetical protein